MGGVIERKLILIDGIAGSGKSVMSQRLYRLLHLNGYSTAFYHEFCRPHPVLNVESESVSDWTDQSLSKWRRFVGHLTKQDSIAVLDGAVFQCGVGELLERDADDRTTQGYARAVADLIRNVRPVMIHLYQRDIEAALRKVRAERPKDWLQRVDRLFADSAYGRNRSLNGFDLYLDFNRSLRRISDNLLETLDIEKLAIDSTGGQWDTCLERIRGYLGLQQKDDPFRPGDYCGEYAVGDMNQKCLIEDINGTLTVSGLFKIVKNLLPKRDDTVFVQTWPDELTFARDETGQVVSFCSTGPWNRLGQGTWTRHEIT